MLESAAGQDEDADQFLENSRLSCQLRLDETMDGIRVHIPEMGPNMLEIPLWIEIDEKVRVMLI